MKFVKWYWAPYESLNGGKVTDKTPLFPFYGTDFGDAAAGDYKTRVYEGFKPDYVGRESGFDPSRVGEDAERRYRDAPGAEERVVRPTRRGASVAGYNKGGGMNFVSRLNGSGSSQPASLVSRADAERSWHGMQDQLGDWAWHWTVHGADRVKGESSPGALNSMRLRDAARLAHKTLGFSPVIMQVEAPEDAIVKWGDPGEDIYVDSPSEMLVRKYTPTKQLLDFYSLVRDKVLEGKPGRFREQDLDKLAHDYERLVARHPLLRGIPEDDTESMAKENYQREFSDVEKKWLADNAVDLWTAADALDEYGDDYWWLSDDYVHDVKDDVKDRATKGEFPLPLDVADKLARTDWDGENKHRLLEPTAADFPEESYDAYNRGWVDRLAKLMPYEDKDVASDSGLKSIRKRLYDDYMASGRPQTKRAVDAVRMPF